MIKVDFSSLKGLGENDGTHFFGNPMLPKKLYKYDFYKEELFIGQINLSDLQPYDKQGLLPVYEGILYIFFDIFTRQYSVHYSNDEDLYLKEDFNKHFDNFRYENALKLDFEECDEEDENKLITKMLCPLNDKIKGAVKNPDDYVCLLQMIPDTIDDLGRNYLVVHHVCSCIIIEKKHLKKKKFSKIKTINI